MEVYYTISGIDINGQGVVMTTVEKSVLELYCREMTGVIKGDKVKQLLIETNVEWKYLEMCIQWMRSANSKKDRTYTLYPVVDVGNSLNLPDLGTLESMTILELDKLLVAAEALKCDILCDRILIAMTHEFTRSNPKLDNDTVLSYVLNGPTVKNELNGGNGCLIQ